MMWAVKEVALGDRGMEVAGITDQDIYGDVSTQCMEFKSLSRKTWPLFIFFTEYESQYACHHMGPHALAPPTPAPPPRHFLTDQHTLIFDKCMCVCVCIHNMYV